MFDWEQFLNTYRIEYITSGPNVARGNVNISCPFCGNDPSHHMGIALDGAGWGCWRDHTHRGKSAARLVQALLGVSKHRAAQITGQQLSVTDDLVAFMESKFGTTQSEPKRVKKLIMPPEFKSFDTERKSANLYKSYLRKRGYTSRQISTLTQRYGVRYCTSGAWRGRIIFPIYFEGKLVNWTGRSIFSGETLRYKTLTADQDRASVLSQHAAIGEATEYVLWYDELMEANHARVVIVEGPFDALRVRTLGASKGLLATCFFTSEPSATQVRLLQEALIGYERIFLLLDEGTMHKAVRVGQRIGSGLGSKEVEVLQLPPGVDDPGDLTKRDFLKLFE